MNDVPALPAGPLAAASLSVVQATVSAPIAGHSIRTFLYARLLAEHESSLNDAAYDEDLLFAACVMRSASHRPSSSSSSAWNPEV